MEHLTLLQLFLWSVLLIGAGQVFWLIRYLLRPGLRRILHCPWCWRDAGIARDFPAPWSSTICPYHAQVVREQQRARHLTRCLPAASPTKPAVPAVAALQVVEEVQG